MRAIRNVSGDRRDVPILIPGETVTVQPPGADPVQVHHPRVYGTRQVDVDEVLHVEDAVADLYLCQPDIWADADAPASPRRHRAAANSVEG
jgi:hypothetical protein